MVFEGTTGLYECICRFKTSEKERELCEFEMDFNSLSCKRLRLVSQ